MRYPDKTESYTFDPAWNRVTEQVRNASQQLTSDKALSYNSRHQLTQISDSIAPSNNATFGYDANGNQTSKTQSGESTQFVFDARNHLRSVTTGGSTVGQFLYDYRGMRTQKQGARGTERYSHDDLAVLFQSDESNSVTALYQYGPDRLLSLTAQNQPTEFYLFDALNSPTALTRADGTISARTSFDVWGNKRRESGESFNRFGFTGHEHDDETGLIYAKARYYDPETARFLSHDPWEGDQAIPPSLHKYLYAYQNPTVYVDPDGRSSLCVRTGPDGERSFSSNCGGGDEIVQDRGGRESVLRQADAEKAAAIQQHQQNVREGEKLRQVGTNPACARAQASANCVSGLPPSQVTMSEGESKPTVQVDTAADIESYLQNRDKFGRAVGIAAATAALLEVASPGGPSTATGKTAAALAQEASDKVARVAARRGAGVADAVPNKVFTTADVAAPKLNSFEGKANVLNTFKGGSAMETTYGEGTRLYRIGDRNGAYWATEAPPATELQWRMDYAVQGEWNNMSSLYTIDIPKGSSLSGLEGIVGAQRGALYGGKTQVFIDWKNVPEDWITTVPLRKQP